MLKRQSLNRMAEMSTAVLVAGTVFMVARLAPGGLNESQWAGGIIAVGGSIALAVIVRVWPIQRVVHPLLRKDVDDPEA